LVGDESNLVGVQIPLPAQKPPLGGFLIA